MLSDLSDRDLRVKIYFDGGCRPNPGVMATAVVAKGVTYDRPAVGTGTSLEAEWLALFQAIDVAAQLGVQDLILWGDAAEVIARASGRLRAKTARDLERLEQFNKAAERFARIRLRHVKRNQNLAGIALAGDWRMAFRDDP